MQIEECLNFPYRPWQYRGNVLKKSKFHKNTLQSLSLFHLQAFAFWTEESVTDAKWISLQNNLRTDSTVSPLWCLDAEII